MLKSYEEIDQVKLSRLILQFNGAIKYTPMLKDHPEWTDQACLNFSRHWHQIAIDRLSKSTLNQDGTLGGPFGRFGRWAPWNEQIPYCRNIPTEAMLKEAGLK